IGPGGAGDIAIIGLALQSVLFPSLGGVALIAATFTAEKENGTIVPLLAAPIRDFDIVLGKLVGMVIPVMVSCALTLTAAYVLALGLVLLAFDVAALEVARRVWQRGEVIGRI